MLASDQRVEDQPVQGCHDRRPPRANPLGGQGDEPVSGSDEWRPERGIAGGHEEQLVARQRQGPAGSEPVLKRFGGVALDRCALALGEMVEKRSHHCWSVAEVVAH